MSKGLFGLHTFPLVAVVTFGCRLVGMSVDKCTNDEARVIK
jgi:hypothetical protein